MKLTLVHSIPGQTSIVNVRFYRCNFWEHVNPLFTIHPHVLTRASLKRHMCRPFLVEFEWHRQYLSSLSYDVSAPGVDAGERNEGKLAEEHWGNLRI